MSASVRPKRTREWARVGSPWGHGGVEDANVKAKGISRRKAMRPARAIAAGPGPLDLTPAGSDPWPPHWHDLARTVAAWLTRPSGAPIGSQALEAVLALNDCRNFAGLKELDNLAGRLLGRPAPTSEQPRQLDWLAARMKEDHAAMIAAAMSKKAIADLLARNLLAYASGHPIRGPLRDRPPRPWVLIDSKDPDVRQTIAQARAAIGELLSPTDLDAGVSYSQIVKAGLAPWGYDTTDWFEHARKSAARKRRRTK